MTKDDLMANWDQIVCDPRLTLDLANRHLERVAESGPAYLLDDYHVVATGGSTGRRAVLVWDFEGFALCFLSEQRRLGWIALNLLADSTPELPISVAAFTSVKPVHMAAAVFECFTRSGSIAMQLHSTSEPIEQMVSSLNELQPWMLGGYPSVLHELALRQLDGSLAIEPRHIECGGEPLLPEARGCLERAFGVPIGNTWGASETGILASSFPGEEGLVIHEDACVLEPVDQQNRPVPIGERAAKVLVTNPLNHVLPIIRYEITDELTMLDPVPDGPWHGRRVADIQGRQDDAFRYRDGTFVPPHLFRSVLTELSDVAEYQVSQTAEGAVVAVVARRVIDAESLARRLERELEAAGLAGARVETRQLEAIERHAASGKLRRFIPL
jgi:phenylacetate-CoA ligase